MIWASGSSGGLWRIDPKTEEVSTLPEEADRPVPDIQSVYEDHEGNIWLATSLGLERLSDVQFTVYTARDGLPSDQITAVQAGKSGRIWAGTLGGLACITNGRIETIHTAGSTEVTSIHEDSQGTLWFGLRDATLHRLDQGKDQQIATLTIADQSGPGWAAGICDGPNGDLWIGTTGAGLHLFNKGDAVKTYTLADGLQDRSVFSLEIDRQQRLWIGEGEGVDLLRKSGIKAVRGENPQTVPSGVLSLHADANENVWAGTDNGLYRFKNGRWGPIVYRPDQRMLGPEFYSLLEDNHDNLWSSGSRGIFFVSKHELKDFFDGKRSSVACHVFGKADGLRSPECTPGFPSACRSADGSLWFATTARLAVVDPNNLRSNPLPPPVQIEKVVVDLTDIHPVASDASSIELCPGAHSFEIDYAGLSFTAPEKVWFRYKLEGFDKDWIDAAGRREAYYTNLAPGTYRFKVVACNNNGLWLPNENAAVITLIIRPHFYQTIWFCALCAVAIIALMWLLWKWRLQQILSERSRLSRELHDTAARGIVALIWQIEGAKTAAQKKRFDTLLTNLESAARLARESLRETRRAVRALVWRLAQWRNIKCVRIDHDHPTRTVRFEIDWNANPPPLLPVHLQILLQYRYQGSGQH
jgi:streptogramin lyase